MSSEREKAAAEEQLATVQASESASRAAEMDLLLTKTSHERTIANLRSQLKDHEQDSEKIHVLQQTVDDLKVQIEEMEVTLSSKCAEIEQHVDRFIA